MLDEAGQLRLVHHACLVAALPPQRRFLLAAPAFHHREVRRGQEGERIDPREQRLIVAR